MTTQSGINRLSNPHVSGPMNDQRITVCKICLFSILVGQPKVWLTDPMGLSHKACTAAPVGVA